MVFAFLLERWRPPSRSVSVSSPIEAAVNVPGGSDDRPPAFRWSPATRGGDLTRASQRATALPAAGSQLQGRQEPQDVRRLLKARRSEVEKLSVAAQPKIVFDIADMSAPYTLYTLKMRSDARMDSALAASRFSNEGEWRLRKRYSEFHAFHRKLRRWETEWKTSRALDGFERLEGALQLATGEQFPRKHIRYDTEDIIRERRVRLAEFVRALLSAYTELEVLFCVLHPPRQRRSDGREESACLHRLFLELERFLAIPPKRKALEARLTRAILALEDMETPAGDGGRTHSCCICLSESDLSESEDGAMVRLPCSHCFHEDCIVNWFHCSATCPMCRRGVAVPAKATNHQASAI